MLESWEFKILIGRISKIISYSDMRLNEMRKIADSAFIRKFGTDSIGLGQLYPSVRRMISSGHYGRWVTSADGLEEHTVYEFDERFDPLRVRHMHGENCTEETYFFDYEGVTCAVPYVNIMNKFYSMGEVYCFIYDEGRLIEFSYITRFRVILYSFDNSDFPHVKLEKYDYICDPDTEPVQKMTLYEYDNENGNISNLTIKL